MARAITYSLQHNEMFSILIYDYYAHGEVVPPDYGRIDQPLQKICCPRSSPLHGGRWLARRVRNSMKVSAGVFTAPSHTFVTVVIRSASCAPVLWTETSRTWGAAKMLDVKTRGLSSVDANFSENAESAMQT
jgi:hypothetical protein